MRRLKLYISALLLFLATGQATAQSQYISNTRDEFSDQIAELGDQYGVVLLSSHNDLVVSVTNLPEGERPVVRRLGNAKRADGLYETQVLVSIKQPKVEVSRRGSVYKTIILAPLTHKGFLAYRVDEVLNPVRLEDQTQANSAHLNASEAELEFTTSIKNLQVVCPPELGAKVTTHTKQGDQSLTVTNVVFPIAALMEARSRYEQAAAECEQQLNYIDSHLETANDADDEKLARLEAARDEAEKALTRIGSVEIYADGTNRMPIDIRQMGPRQKKVYAVLPVVIEKKVIQGEYSNYMDQAGRMFGERRYADARTAYLNALKAPDVVDNMKPIIRQSLAECDSCQKHNTLAFAAMKKIGELRKASNGSVDQALVAEYAAIAIDGFKHVAVYNPDEYYPRRVRQLEEFLGDMPLQLRFSVYEWVNLRQGAPIGNVEVWAYYGAPQDANATIATDRLFEKAVKRHSGDYAQLGVTDPDGKAEVDLDRRHQPTAIIFRPRKASGVRIYSIPYPQLIDDAEGNYMKKTFTLRMFRKI